MLHFPLINPCSTISLYTLLYFTPPGKAGSSLLLFANIGHFFFFFVPIINFSLRDLRIRSTRSANRKAEDFSSSAIQSVIDDEIGEKLFGSKALKKSMVNGDVTDEMENMRTMAFDYTENRR